MSPPCAYCKNLSVKCVGAIGIDETSDDELSAEPSCRSADDSDCILTAASAVGLNAMKVFYAKVVKTGYTPSNLKIQDDRSPTRLKVQTLGELLQKNVVLWKSTHDRREDLDQREQR